MQPGILASADRHYADMLELGVAAQAVLKRAWARVEPAAILDSWDRLLATVLPAFVTYQITAAAAGAQSTAEDVAEQGLNARPEAAVIAATWGGWASDGRALESLLAQPAAMADQLVAEGFPVNEALEAGEVSLKRIAKTQISDAGRVAAGVGVAVRPRVGWVRMLNPPSCDRCLVLAGRVYRWSDGFDRHPNDDCVSVTVEAEAAREYGRDQGLVEDPKGYFDSLDRGEQDAMFGKANAQAVRDGADIGQVVNARRGMSTAGGFTITTEGATTRGFAGRRLGARSGQVATRLTPESIYRLASSREDALRLLRRHAYIV